MDTDVGPGRLRPVLGDAEGSNDPCFITSEGASIWDFEALYRYSTSLFIHVCDECGVFCGRRKSACRVGGLRYCRMGHIIQLMVSTSMSKKYEYGDVMDVMCRGDCAEVTLYMHADGLGTGEGGGLPLHLVHRTFLHTIP